MVKHKYRHIIEPNQSGEVKLVVTTKSDAPQVLKLDINWIDNYRADEQETIAANMYFSY